MDALQTFWATPAGWTLITLGEVLLVVVGVLISLAFLLLADRKVWAGVQMRKGPNMVGAFGLLQSFADFLKFLLKEIVIPAGADRTVFLLAPLVSFVLAFIGWAVIPFAPGWVVSNINVGILYLLAMSSLGVYGIIMGGWASNSKYPFLGSLRSAAQMVSYEVSIGFIIVTVILLTGSMNLQAIVEHQAGFGMQGHLEGRQGIRPVIEGGFQAVVNKNHQSHLRLFCQRGLYCQGSFAGEAFGQYSRQRFRLRHLRCAVFGADAGNGVVHTGFFLNFRDIASQHHAAAHADNVTSQGSYHPAVSTHIVSPCAVLSVFFNARHFGLTGVSGLFKRVVVCVIAVVLLR